MKVDMIKKPHVMTKLWMKIAEAIYKNLSKGNDILLNCNLKFAKREPNIPGRPHKLQIYTVESELYSPELTKCYFLQIHAKICSKVPIFYFNRPKCLPDNCFVTWLLREKSALSGNCRDLKADLSF